MKLQGKNSLQFGVVLIVVFLISICSSQAQNSKVSAKTALHSLFEEISIFDKSLNKRGSIYRGQHPKEIGYHDEEDYKQQLETYTGFLNTLESFNLKSIPAADVISLETMRLKLSGTIGQLKHQSYLIPFNAEGGFFNSLSSAIKRLPFSSLEDFEQYALWLPTYADFIKGHQDLMQIGISKGIVAPKVIVNNFIAQVSPWASRDQEKHPFTSMLTRKPESMSAKAWGKSKQQILEIMYSKVWPAYDELLRFTKEEYTEAAYAAPGISNIPNGKSYYEDRVAYYTTLDVSPEEIFTTGKEEVSRIRSSMEAIIEELGFEGSFADFVEFLRTDEQFYAKTPQQLLSYAAWLSKKAEGQLPRLFSKLYEVPFTVEPVPDDIAPTYTGGRYVQGSRSQDRPGIYWVNTYNLPARSLYNIPALTVHEAVPGHHLQIMLASELEGLPSFRKNFYISAFGEGWGLYSEYLGEEMGMYETPYDRFGRFTYEMWRACRLVVDVGLHYKNWTRQEAVDFLASNTALSIHEVNTEIDRYIGWPGQALSYKIGEITIKNLRSKATEVLGDKFNIKEFHHQILKNGSVPLPTLIREIDDWIENEIQKE